MRPRPLAIAAFVLAAAIAGCGGDESDGTDGAVDGSASVAEEAAEPSTSSEASATQEFPDVIGVEAMPESAGSWTFAVTISSPYDSPERYADAWRVVGPDGEVYGERILLHDHAAEQPFTRSQGGIEIPADVDVVVVEGRDLVNGWGGTTLQYELPEP